LSSATIWSPILNDREIGREERLSEEQIIGFLREVEARMAIKVLCRQQGFSEASYYLWRSKFGGMSVSTPSGSAADSSGSGIRQLLLWAPGATKESATGASTLV